MTCPHSTVNVYSKLLRAATYIDPPEYSEWAICTECGERIDGDDIPDTSKQVPAQWEPDYED